MKKITSYLIIIGAIFLISQNLQAQAFQKGNVNVDVGLGFGIYGTSQTATTGLTADVNGTSLVILPETTSDTTDGAASTMIPISFEYGISNRIGLG
jgi:hypothetical protein